ncbi:hypothetical protein [Ostreiculturibacter nitratireducens]|uniref:hypothetical protein n=1 Tax=Ostreiculturibacter nitratireducens TaxID=3075226 RepID=UPI0031B5E1C9
MSKAILTKTRIHAGRWEGLLEVSADEPPGIAVTHLGEPVPGHAVDPLPGAEGKWTLSVPIPAELLSDGVQTFVISDAETGERLASFAIVAGEPLEDDLRAEIDLLRAELDLLKKAFRRHCAETGG